LTAEVFFQRKANAMKPLSSRGGPTRAQAKRMHQQDASDGTAGIGMVSIQPCVDGVARPVCLAPDGRQFVIGHHGRRVYGLWVLAARLIGPRD
jgi:hypothetical protein